MFSHLSPSQDAVIDGLEDHEKIYALDQAEYLPLRTLPGQDGNSAITKWQLSDEQRQAIANGADILLEVFHFKQPLAPVRLFMADKDGQERYKEFFLGEIR